MVNNIFPRSPREQMAGWSYLPRFVDKIRLDLAGRLPADYQENYCQALDKLWLDAAGISATDFINVVRKTLTDGEVTDWILHNVKKTALEKESHRKLVMARGSDSEQGRLRLKQRKQQAGMAGRDDIQCFVDFIDADEGRLDAPRF